MNGRRLFREYAQSKGKVAKEFIEITSEWESYTLHTKDDDGKLETLTINYRDMVHWIIKTKKMT